MKKTSKTIVFFGNERIATGISTTTPVLKALIENGYTIAAIVSNYDEGHSRHARKLEVAEIASQYNIPLLLPDRISGIKNELVDLKASAGVLVAYGKIIPEEIIDIFPTGIINIHPSLLPKHRGSTPIESVILNGEQSTGVSLMKLVKEMDAGPVYGYSHLELTGHESKQELADNLLDIGKSMVIELLPGILDGTIVPEEQNHQHATYDSLIKKSDGIIDWTKPAQKIEAEIRAYKSWPRSTTILNGIEVIITEARISDETGDAGDYSATKNSLTMHCGEKSIAIERVQPAGKKEMPIQAFLAGYKL